jgi:hypothetical protein
MWVSSAQLPAAPPCCAAHQHHSRPAPHAQVRCGSAEGSASRKLSAQLFRRFFKAQPYSAVDVGAWKIVMLNSQLGHTWDYSHPECNTRHVLSGLRVEAEGCMRGPRPGQA